MKEENDISLNLILSKVFQDRKFLESVYDAEQVRNTPINTMIESLNVVLRYYIMTRDTNTSYTYKEIEEMYNKLVTRDLDAYKQCEPNIMEKGFMTSSFNPTKKDLIEKYGFDYIHKLTDEEKATLDSRRENLSALEDLLGRSKYVEGNNYKDLNIVFMTSPGTKTIYYTMLGSPERLFLGPLKQQAGKEEPVIVGESKKDYYLRVLDKKLIDKFGSKDSPDYIKYRQISEKVLDDYCTDVASFAMIDLDKILDVNVARTRYDPDRLSKLGDYIRGQQFPTDLYFFTEGYHDDIEHNNLGNLTTLGEEIPKDSIRIVDMLDSFEISQLYAKSQGLKYGDVVDFKTFKKLDREPSISMLVDMLKGTNNPEKLGIIKEKYDEESKRISERKEVLEKRLKLRFGLRDVSKESILKRKDELQEKKKEIFDRDFIHKEGIEPNGITLKTMWEKLSNDGLMDSLLKSDEDIVWDENQFNSDIHGRNHTRRVNFMAHALMSQKSGFEARDREILLTIVKNHDIGRVNDFEDKTHGENAVQILTENPTMLKGFSKEERELIKFVIKEHSLSSSQNERDLNAFQRETDIINVVDFIKNSKDYKEGEIPKLTNSKITQMFTKLKRAYGMEVDPKKERVTVADFRRTRPLSEEEMQLFMRASKDAEGFKKLDKKSIPILQYRNMLEIFKDADKLDRVRLDPYGRYPIEGLDVSRLKQGKDLEYLAYESLDKYVELIEVEKELRDLEEYKDILVQEEAKEAFESMYDKKRNFNLPSVVKKTSKISLATMWKSMKDLMFGKKEKVSVRTKDDDTK